jgi:hypothetical protein
VLIIIGDYPEKRVVFDENNIKIVETDNNSIDYTAMITLLEQPEILTTDWFFYIHDTVQFGSQFFNRLNHIMKGVIEKCKTTKITTVSFNFPSSNNGIYHKYVINRLKPAILKFKNTDNSILQELKSLFVATEDAIFRMNMQEHVFFPTAIDVGWQRPRPDFYNTGKTRLTEYYPDLDIWKFKATFGLAYTYVLEV